MWIDRVMYDDYENIIPVLLRKMEYGRIDVAMLSPGILYLKHATPLNDKGLLRLVAEYL